VIGWLISHSAEIALIALGFIGGVFFAAWRQLRAERIEDDQWVAMMRGGYNREPISAVDWGQDGPVTFPWPTDEPPNRKPPA
jgi:hypothetical protein